MARVDPSQQDHREAIFAEWKRRRALEASAPSLDSQLERIESQLFDKTRAVLDAIKRGARRICLFTSRRAGKTTFKAQLACWVALKTRDSAAVIPYISLTRGHAKTFFWQILKAIGEPLGFKANESDLSLRKQGCATIQLFGLDDKTAIDKVLGGKMPLAMVDEAQSQPMHLKEFVESKLSPALSDLAGPLILSGTPHPACVGYFYDLTCDSKPRTTQRVGSWLVARWDIRDNTKYPRDPEEVLREVRADNGWDENNSTYRRDWLGEHHRTTEALVYQFGDELNVYDDGEMPDADWFYGLGIDVGTNDADAFTVLAHSPHVPVAYYVKAYGRSGQDITATGDHTLALVEKYKPTLMVMDTGALGKKIALELNNRRNLSIIAADKAHKPSAIKIQNGELRAGRVKAHKRDAAELIYQWKTLPWADPVKREKELDGVKNDVADSALYIHRAALTHLYREIAPKPKPGSDEAHRAAAARHKLEAMKRAALTAKLKGWRRA